jgi:hypothetical protein
LFGKPTLIGGFFRFYKINLFEYQLIKNNFVYINIFVYFCNQQITINMKKLKQITDYLNNLLLKYEWCTSHRDRYSIQEPKKEENKIRIWQTTYNGITTKHK